VMLRESIGKTKGLSYSAHNRRADASCSSSSRYSSQIPLLVLKRRHLANSLQSLRTPAAK
jgi:hypothetical protein